MASVPMPDEQLYDLQLHVKHQNERLLQMLENDRDQKHVEMMALVEVMKTAAAQYRMPS